MLRPLSLVLTGALALSACGLVEGAGEGGKRVTFDGQLFRGSAKSVDRSDRSHFIATAGPASRSIEGVREAVRYEGTKYCIKWFGISDIAWEVDPQAEALPVANDKVTLRGTCLE